MAGSASRRAPSDSDREAGRLFRAARERAGLSLKEAAVRAEYSEDSIYRIERGEVWPPYESLLRLAAAYGIMPGDFFANSAASPDLILVEPLLAALRGLPNSAQDELIRHLAAQTRMTRAFMRGAVLEDRSNEPKNVVLFPAPNHEERKEMTDGDMEQLAEIMKLAGAVPRKAARGPEREVRFFGRASAGEGIEFFDDIPEEYRQIPQWAWNKGARGVFKAAGESMIDVGIFPDDIMFVKPTPEPSNGAIVVCTLNKKVFVKKLKRDERGVPARLESKNPKYTNAIEITVDDEIEFFGEVVGRTGDL